MRPDHHRRATATSLRRGATAIVSILALAAIAGVALSGDLTLGGTQPPLTFPIEDPITCSACHGDFNTLSNHEQWPTWAGSMMANAGRDPLFWAALDVANNDLEGAGDFCLRCHAPAAWLAGRFEPPDGSTDGCSLIGNLDQQNSDFSGISCPFCHRMQVNDDPPPGEDSVYYENGKYWIDDGDCPGPGSEPCRRGPYDYTGPGGGNPPPHEWAFSSYHVDSDICGNCHNVSSPALNLIDENGADTGIPFPIERTFKEWQQSDFAPGGGSEQTCQGCHMEDAEGDPIYACLQQSNNRAGELATHRLAGGNTWIPAVLQGEYPALGRADEFDATIAWAQDMLQNRSATVEVESLGGSTLGGALAAGVRITNLTGHKLPTGYPEGRRMWLQLTARDGNSEVVFESGAYDAATGELTEDTQAKIYHVEPGIWDLNGTGECDVEDGGGNPLFHFVLNNCIVVDNRIPPLGFTGGADLETRPVGYGYPETSPGSGVLVNYDVTRYDIPVPEDAPDPITVEATLFFQTASKEYVEFLRDQAVAGGFPDDCLPRTAGTPTQSRGELLYDMWALYDRSPPVDMGSASQQIVRAIFADGFESGDTASWSSTTP